MAKGKWDIDVSHSSVDFSVKHLMISKVKGTFTNFTAEINADENDIENADVSFEIQVASVNTNNAERDAHLRTGDFFEVDKFPSMHFKSSRIIAVSDDTYEFEGDFKIKGVTHKEKFTVEFGGVTKDPYGNTKAGFSVQGKIKRSDYGLNYNAVLETGGMLIGDVVNISADIQAAKVT